MDERNRKSSFAKRLKLLREEKGLSMGDLAEATGFSKAMVSLWERNLNVPTIESAIKLAYYFGVTLHYIVGFEE